MARHSKRKTILFLLLMPSLYSCNFDPQSSFSSASPKNSQQSLKFLLEPKEILAAGEFQSLNLILKNGNKSIEPDKSDVTWISSDEKVAFVNQFGLVAARKPGKTKIKAYLRENLDIFSEFDLQVIGKQDVKSITINPKEIIIQLGDEKQLTAVVELGDGSFNGNVSWSSEDSRIVQVNESGKIRANNIGIASIVAAYSPDTKSRTLVKIEVVNELKSTPTLASSHPISSVPTQIISPPPSPNILPSPTPQITSNPIVQASSTANVPTVQITATPLIASSATPTPIIQITSIPSPSPTLTPPTGLTKSSVTSNGFRLSWGAVSGATSYRVYKNNSLLSSNVTSTAFNVVGLNANTQYSMQVSAVNSGGESAKSVSLDVSTLLSVIVNTFAGSGLASFADGTGILAHFNSPFGLAADASGNLYVGDWQNQKIRKITSGGVVTTLAGSGIQGYSDGPGNSSRFAGPLGMAVDRDGNVYVADTGNNRIRKITQQGVVSTLAGSGPGYADGVGTNTKFYNPYGIAVDSNGNIYVADTANNRIRKITSDGTVSTLAGSSSGYADGTGADAKFNFPYGVAVDNSGNVYVADYSNYRIRKVTAGGIVSTLAGNGSFGNADGTGTNAQFYNPSGITVDSNGNLFVTDYAFCSVRKITSNGVVSTLAGNGQGYADGSGSEAIFNFPRGIAVNGSGDIYVADTANNRIRKIMLSP